METGLSVRSESERLPDVGSEDPVEQDYLGTQANFGKSLKGNVGVIGGAERTEGGQVGGLYGRRKDPEWTQKDERKRRGPDGDDRDRMQV